MTLASFLGTAPVYNMIQDGADFSLVSVKMSSIYRVPVYERREEAIVLFERRGTPVIFFVLTLYIFENLLKVRKNRIAVFKNGGKTQKKKCRNFELPARIKARRGSKSETLE